LALATASIAALLVVACSDSGDPVAPPTVPANVSFKKHIQPIYNSRCAIAGAHVMPNPQAGLDLSPGVAYANTVNVPTQVFTPGVRVTPDDPSQSVLYLLVESGQMPDKGRGSPQSRCRPSRMDRERGSRQLMSTVSA
jgi:hypothetical protein